MLHSPHRTENCRSRQNGEEGEGVSGGVSMSENEQNKKGEVDRVNIRADCVWV